MSVNLFIFTNDLRLEDNPLLNEATKDSILIPVFILDTKARNNLYGKAFEWWLYQNLLYIKDKLKTQYGIDFSILQGNWIEEAKKLIDILKPNKVYINKQINPHLEALVNTLKGYAYNKNIKIVSEYNNIMIDPSKILNDKQQPYKRFSAFWKHWLTYHDEIRKPVNPPKNIIGNSKYSVILRQNFTQLTNIYQQKWHKKLAKYWSHAGEQYALKLLHTFATNKIHTYHKSRDYPALESTSKLSPYLAVGAISPNQIWYKIIHSNNNSNWHHLSLGAQCFLKELVWREFSYYLLFYHPKMSSQPLITEFKEFQWHTDTSFCHLWQKGLTGYPIVDAGMRELWNTGWMHNRIRMIVASFFIKNGLQNWIDGEEWFWDTLIDADLASNSQNWQWVCGCGVDALPYFRIFNPSLQSMKFDPYGEYIKKWVPEIKLLPTKFIHQPWLAPTTILQKAGIKLGLTYPNPIVDYTKSKNRYLIQIQKIYKKNL